MRFANAYAVFAKLSTSSMQKNANSPCVLRCAIANARSCINSKCKKHNKKNQCALHVGTSFVRSCLHSQCKKCKLPLLFALWHRANAMPLQLLARKPLRKPCVFDVGTPLLRSCLLFHCKTRKQFCFASLHWHARSRCSVPQNRWRIAEWNAPFQRCAIRPLRWYDVREKLVMKWVLGGWDNRHLYPSIDTQTYS